MVALKSLQNLFLSWDSKIVTPPPHNPISSTLKNHWTEFVFKQSQSCFYLNNLLIYIENFFKTLNVKTLLLNQVLHYTFKRA